jgi:hypothetical protein
MEYIIKHSLRTLIKKGHPETLEFRGYNLNPNVSYSKLVLSTSKIRINDKIKFSFEVEALEESVLIIDYKTIYPTKHGKTTSKTYKLKVLKMKQGQKEIINGTRSFKPISTRNFYFGKHKIEIQVNGKVVLSEDFNLVE